MDTHKSSTMAVIKKIPGINFFIKSKTWQSFRHEITLITDTRDNSTFTGFLRLPTQFEALSGPVLDFLLPEQTPKNLKIAVLGCSSGSEAYTIASVLMNQHQSLKFSVYGFDIDQEMINKAKGATYIHQEIFNNKIITSSFVNSTFDIKEDLYRIKEKIANNVYFSLANALDPNLKEVIGASDIVFAQNFLLHMKPKIAINAFNNICLLLKPRSALFVDGVDLGIRQKLTKKNRLEPLVYKLKQIHNEARRARGIGWPYSYWGLEPFSTTRKNWERRYSTIFLSE
jgi:chemotaxis methyl-accepting protein methylase